MSTLLYASPPCPRTDFSPRSATLRLSSGIYPSHQLPSLPRAPVSPRGSPRSPRAGAGRARQHLSTPVTREKAPWLRPGTALPTFRMYPEGAPLPFYPWLP